ncbi:uncharacterized protein PITG_01303 [Phytophthora infestans T30-4]|uniref:Uncharacterized protein n=1 Tax=Phytophthora infestans (strain T30-4) TaxID=403677 RepID=D0MV64_PHYIT|nr:uncharacterized protein PITG_01303 [Phytophthora infestans T30-4]EEY61060.1 conserved hypothetical protein [Phytophthora infestans T30-4]|eukprot:XP_002907977.1 conserved hypothetical protein [Phytophthora infestans T30-4]
MKFHYGSTVKACLHPDLPAAQIQDQTQQVSVPPVVTMPQVMPPQFILRSPTSAEQWPVPSSTAPVFKPCASTCWPQQDTVQQHQVTLPYGHEIPLGIYSPTRSCSELFEDVWNSEMLDTLVNVLHDPTVRC